MAELIIDGVLLRKMIISGANLLEEHKPLVDSLNVFPVPDGDTGTNMSLTILAAAREAIKIETTGAYDIAKAAAAGSLRGARGNSGVIVSQLFRGFAKSLEGKDTINCADIARGLVKASETAYKAVMKPKEGTILTIARVLGEKAADASGVTNDFDVFAAAVMEAGHNMLLKTTNMLPQLKEAGVIDAGGKGLLIFLEGAIKGAREKGDITIKEFSKTAAPAADFSALNTEDITFAYCTEFFINLTDTKSLDNIIEDLQAFLDKIGDSIVVVGDEEIIKIHVHTNNPGQALEHAIKYGYLSNLKIENMKLQHTSLIEQTPAAVTAPAPAPDTAPKEVGIAAVATGDGLTNLFKELGADAVIEGGQSMNPSAEDFLDAINSINAKNIILLPNNKNIILAATQAGKLTKDKTVYTVPTRTMPEGFAAMINNVSVHAPEEMVQHMNDAINTVTTGEVTFAVRDTTVSGKKIKKNDIIGLTGGKIEVVAKDIATAAFELLNKMASHEDAEIVTIYYGKDVTEEDANALRDKLAEANDSVDIEVQFGGQPLYYYIFSVE